MHYLPYLATYRASAGLSVTELASRAELSRETVARLEKLQRRAHLGTAQALAFVLGMPMEHLIGNQRQPPQGPMLLRWELRAGTGTQVCRDCKRQKPLEAFTRIRSCREGSYGRCKGCRAARARERYHSDPEFRAREQARRRRRPPVSN